MGILFHISLWALTAIAADYTFHKYFYPSSTIATSKDSTSTVKSDLNYNNTNPATSPPPPSQAENKKIIRTMTWRRSSQPNSLLFDFSGLGIKHKQDLFNIIQSNLSQHISVCVKMFKESEYLIEMMLQSHSIFMLKQTRSILRHRGMKISPTLWLTPTRTLTYNSDWTHYWIIRIFNLPLDESILVHQDQQKENIANSLKQSFGCRCVVIVDPKDVHFETVTRLSSSILNGNATILLQEFTTTAATNKSTFSAISLTRRFVYLSCYKRHFPIQMKLIR